MHDIRNPGTAAESAVRAAKTVACTTSAACENRRRADERIPNLLDLRHEADLQRLQSLRKL